MTHDPRDHWGAYVRQVDAAYGGALLRSDTRDAAHKSIQPVRARYQRMVLDWLERTGGGTCDAFEVATGLSHQLASPRFTELRNSGAIEDSGQRSRTRSGRSAAVYRIRK